MLAKKIRRKQIIVFTALVIFLFICSWGVVYASAERMLELYPSPESTVADEQPMIAATWLNIPGVQIKSLDVRIDDQPQTIKPPSSGTGFSVRPTEPLSQGRHIIQAKLTYGLGIPRQVEARWSFIVDTQPPPLNLADEASFYVSDGPNAKFTAKSEPGVTVAMTLNESPAGEAVVDKNGDFDIDLRGLNDNNQLRLMASDPVGNSRSIVLPVIKDETAPVINSIKPAEGEVVRLAAPTVEVTFGEQESGLKSITLLIDGQEAVVKGDDGSKKVTYLGDMLKDGDHTVKVEAVDYAGRNVAKEWGFSIDSRHIVISRAERKLYFYKDGSLQRVVRVAVGQPRWPTPRGSWRIINKQVNPVWRNPGSSWAKDMPKVIPAGSSNPLGLRALALSASNILIHGTSNYRSIGSAVSHGCIRMTNRDIINFFPLVSVGVPVDIIN